MEQTVSVKKDAKREIMRLALLLEDVSDLTVFVDYSGHVNKLDIWIVEDWKRNRNDLLRKGFYTDFAYETSEKDYLEIKLFLQSKIEEYTAI